MLEPLRRDPRPAAAAMRDVGALLVGRLCRCAVPARWRASLPARGRLRASPARSTATSRPAAGRALPQSRKPARGPPDRRRKRLASQRRVDERAVERIARRLDADDRRAPRAAAGNRRSPHRPAHWRSPRASISPLWFSSSTAKRAGTLASNGTRCSSRSQKAWMVSIFRPPGVSTARANSVRASRTCARVGVAPSSSVSSATRLSSSSVTQRPSRSNTRIAMLAAAALVKVRQRMRPGGAAVEQQAHDAVGEHLGLARARIGRHPGGGARIGGAALRVLGVVAG